MSTKGINGQWEVGLTSASAWLPTIILRLAFVHSVDAGGTYNLSGIRFQRPCASRAEHPTWQLLQPPGVQGPACYHTAERCTQGGVRIQPRRRPAMSPAQPFPCEPTTDPAARASL